MEIIVRRRLIFGITYGFDMKCITNGSSRASCGHCRNDAVITNQSELYKDIRTVKVEQLAFKKDFKVVFNRDDTCHAIVVRRYDF